MAECDEQSEVSEAFDGSIASAEEGDVPLEDGVVAASQACKPALDDSADEQSEHGTLSADTIRMGSPERPPRVRPPRFSPSDDVFSSPACGNSGPGRAEVVQMCIALMQYFSDNFPSVLKCLRQLQGVVWLRVYFGI